MQRRQRNKLAFYVSVATHAVIMFGPVVTGITCGVPIELPDLDFDVQEIELLDPEALQDEKAPEKAEPEPPPPEEPPPAPEPTEPPKPIEPEEGPEPVAPEPTPEEKPKPKKKRKFAAKGSRADRLAPPSSTFHMLLVPKKIRRLPFSDKVLDIMAPLPDFEFLVDGGRFDAMRDFDHIVIASSDIRDWTQTFLAVDYNISQQEVQRAIERAAATRNEVVEWIEGDGLLRANPRPADPDAADPDNRWFVFLEDGVAIYVRDEFLPSILAGPTGDNRRTSGNYVANLAKLRRFAQRQPRAGVQLVVKGLGRSARRNPLPFEIPNEFEISASASKRPEVAVRVTFSDEDQAFAFIKWWKEVFTSSGWGLMASDAKIERDELTVRLSKRMTTGQATLIMDFAAGEARKIAGKTTQQIAEMRRRRAAALEARKGTKLPPSVLDPTPANESGDDGEPVGQTPPGATTPKDPPDQEPATPPPGERPAQRTGTLLLPSK